MQSRYRWCKESGRVQWPVLRDGRRVYDWRAVPVSCIRKPRLLDVDPWPAVSNWQAHRAKTRPAPRRFVWIQGVRKRADCLPSAQMPIGWATANRWALWRLARRGRRGVDRNWRRGRRSGNWHRPTSPEVFSLRYGQCFGNIVDVTNQGTSQSDGLSAMDFAPLRLSTGSLQSCSQQIVDDLFDSPCRCDAYAPTAPQCFRLKSALLY